MSRLRVGLVSALACLVLLDVLVHLFVVRGHWRPVPPFGALTNDRQRAWVEERVAVLTGSREEEGLGIFDPHLGWTLRPDASTADGKTTTNSRGWRGPGEPGDASPPGVLRIVCAGDSFTFCEEVADDEAWPYLLQQRLGERAEVVNLGVGGFGTDQALIRFGREYPPAPVDVVFVGLLLENIGRNVNRYRPRWYPRAESAGAKPRFIEGNATLELIELPYQSELEFLDALASGAVLADLAEHEHWLEDHVPGPLALSGLFRLYAGERFYAERELPRLWADVEGEPFRVTTRLLRAFSSIARAPERNGARLVPVVVFPTKDDLARYRADGERYWQPLLDWLVAERMPFVDLTDALATAEDGRASGDPPLWGFSHLSAAGNAVVARTLHGFLETHL